MRFATLFIDVQSEDRWLCVGVAWCEVIGEQSSPGALQLELLPHCCVHVISAN